MYDPTQMQETIKKVSNGHAETRKILNLNCKKIGSRVLVIDDDVIDRMTMNRILKGLGYDVVLVATGAEALDVLKLNNIGLVITDLMMPFINGLDIIKELYSHPHISVIVTTGLDEGAETYQEVADMKVKILAKPLDEKIVGRTVMVQFGPPRKGAA